MEVHLTRRTAVEATLDLGESGERRQRPVAGPVREPGFLDERGDVGVGADDPVLRGDDVDLGGRDPAPQDRLGFDRPAAHRDAVEHRRDLVEVGTDVDEAAERHVTGNAGEAVEPRHRRHGSSRAVAQAAP